MGAMGAIRNSLRFVRWHKTKISIFRGVAAVAYFCTFTNYRASFGPQPAECIPSEKCLLGFQPRVFAEWKYEVLNGRLLWNRVFIPVGLNKIYFWTSGVFSFSLSLSEWWILWSLWNARLVCPPLSSSLHPPPPPLLNLSRPRSLWNGLFLHDMTRESVISEPDVSRQGHLCRSLQSQVIFCRWSVYIHKYMEKLLNNSEWVQTVWVLGSDGWFSPKFWLHNVSAHHNWRSFFLHFDVQTTK